MFQDYKSRSKQRSRNKPNHFTKNDRFIPKDSKLVEKKVKAVRKIRNNIAQLNKVKGSYKYIYIHLITQPKEIYTA